MRCCPYYRQLCRRVQRPFVLYDEGGRRARGLPVASRGLWGGLEHGLCALTVARRHKLDLAQGVEAAHGAAEAQVEGAAVERTGPLHVRRDAATAPGGQHVWIERLGQREDDGR